MKSGIEKMIEFDRPKKTLAWARKNLLNLETAEQNFVASKPFEIWFKDTVLPGQVPFRHYKAIKIRQPGDDIQELVYRLIGDLRAVLDHSVVAASEIINKERKLRTNFPFGDTQTYVEKQLSSPNGPFAGIPIELHAKLLSFEPFAIKTDGSEGNAPLWLLNKGANTNKHNFAIETSFSDFGIHLDQITGGTFVLLNKRVAADEIDLFKIVAPIPGAEFRVRLEVSIRFSYDRYLGGRLITDMFRDMFAAVSLIVREIEAETLRVISRQ